MRIRLSNISGMVKYLKANSSKIQDVTDRKHIGDKFVDLNPKSVLEFDDMNDSRLSLVADDYIFVVKKGKDGSVSKVEAVQNNNSNRELVHKYITEGKLDLYDEFIRI